MTVNADIVTKAKQDVLLLPASAVKTASGSKYVQKIGPDGKPKSAPVRVGDSNDTSVEIVSGLSEGDRVVARTVAASAKAAAATPSILNSFGGARASGAASAGAVRNVQFISR